MSSTDRAVRRAACRNVADCATARAGETLGWYRGAGEYCPECGEALTTHVEPNAPPPSAPVTPSETPHARALETQSISAPIGIDRSARLDANEPPAIDQLGREAFLPLEPDLTAALEDFTAAPASAAPLRRPPRWIWIATTGIALAILLVGAFFYLRRPLVATTSDAAADVVAVCTIPSAQTLAAELVRGYAAKTATAAGRFRLMNANPCGVSFSTTPETPDAVIARDGIVAIVNPLNPIPHLSEQQLRAIYRGSIRDWSQLGGPRGPIVALLPGVGTDEAKALATTLFFGVSIDRTVRRSGSSAEVTRTVSGADRTGRGAIGLVAFSQAVPARVVPLAYLPPPSVLSISTRHYPYTFTIAVGPGSAQTSPAAQGLIDFARSTDGAAIVAKTGLIPREGF